MHTLAAAAPHVPTLARLGVHDWGSLRALPRGGMARRFGAALLDALDCAYGQRPERYPWLTVPEVFEDPQVKHLNVTTALPTKFGKNMHFITQPVVLSRTPSQVVAPAPGWGEHTDEVLGELGFSASAISGFHARGVV